MRIAIVINDMHPSSGGPPRVVLGHALELRRRGHQPEILCTELEGRAEQARAAWPELVEAGIPMHLFPRDGYGPMGRSRALTRHLAGLPRDHFHVMHVHGMWELCLASAARFAGRWGIPCVVSPHGMLDRYSLGRSRTKKWMAWNLLGIGRMMRSADGMQFGTPDERDEAADLGLGYRPYIIPNGLHLDRFHRDPGAGLPVVTADFPQLSGRSPLLLFYSRMHPKKGIDILLEGFASIAGDFPEAGLLVAALEQDPEYDRAMRARAGEPDLRDRVAITTDYTGERGQQAIDSVDAFVLTSHQEGFSMAILEAMAYRLPVLITHPCHMDELAEVGAGEVVNPDVHSVAEGLRRILERSPEDLERMGQRGHDWVSKHCAWSRIAELLEAMYQELMELRGLRP